jgi:hypothetical protein
VYFIDGPARGQSMLKPRQPSRPTWNDDHGTVHTYRSVTRVPQRPLPSLRRLTSSTPCALHHLRPPDRRTPFTERETGHEFHPACVAERVPQDAVIAIVGALARVLAPTILVWAS